HTTRLDRQTQHHLATQRWNVAQLAVVEPIERRLVAIEHDLNLFVGAARRSAGPRAIARSRGAARARPAADRVLHATCFDAREVASTAAVAADLAAQRREIDAAARS